ncbi:hypothetical protein A2U01_0052284, partial [Trifolium medium]|nr:hypothetical protein [Trifolium medium]
RAMKEDGIIITRDDIVQVSPVKKRKDSSDSEDDQLASEGKDTVGTEGTFAAQVDKGKEPIVSDTAAATAPKKKRSDKDKIEVVVKEKEKRKRIAASESDKEKVSKKPRIQKKKVTRKLVIQDEDDEETDDEPLQMKRKRTEPEVKEMNAEADA